MKMDVDFAVLADFLVKVMAAAHANWGGALMLLTAAALWVYWNKK